MSKTFRAAFIDSTRTVPYNQITMKWLTMSLRDFLDFVREQGIVGLAVGFILGGSIQKVVSALVNDIINPLLGIFIGVGDNLTAKKVTVGPAIVLWGDFVKVLIDFIIVATVAYLLVRIINIKGLDKKKT